MLACHNYREHQADNYKTPYIDINILIAGNLLKPLLLNIALLCLSHFLLVGQNSILLDQYNKD